MKRGRTLLLVICVLSSSLVGADDSVRTLREALQRQNEWLAGDADRGPRWRDYLRVEELQSQLEQGSSADAQTLREILAIYQRDVVGLERPRFAAVRDALAAWVDVLPPVALGDLAEATRAASDSFQSVSEEQLAAKKKKIRKALAGLDGYFAPASDDIIRRWKEYLLWDDLLAELNADEPDLAKLVRIRRKYYANFNGLDLPVFRDARQQLTSYMSLLQLSKRKEPQTLFRSRLDQLAKQLAADKVNQSDLDRIAMGRVVGWLDNAEQTPELVQAIRRHYWQSNLHASVSLKLVRVGVQEKIDETDSVNEFILGTSIYGTARTQGEVDLQFVPNEDRASFEMLLTGHAFSDNVGYNGPVTIYSNGVTGISASKVIHVDENGLEDEPALASCWTDSNINSIAARLGLVRRIAWKRARRTKGQAEGIASASAQQKTAARVDAQAAPMLADAQERYTEKVKKPLLRLDSFPNQLKLRTTENELHATAMHASKFQMAATSMSPALESELDLSCSVHESLPANFAETLLGGKEVTNRQLATLLDDWGVEVPAELAGEDEADWSITFSPDRPFQVAFSGEVIQLKLRGVRFTRGDQEIRSPIVISATYSIERSGRGIRLVRQGEVAVNYIRQQRLSVGKVAMKTFLQSRFNGLFEPEIETEGLRLPGRWEPAGILEMKQMHCDGGWLVFGWKMPDPSIRTAEAPTEP